MYLTISDLFCQKVKRKYFRVGNNLELGIIHLFENNICFRHFITPSSKWVEISATLLKVAAFKLLKGTVSQDCSGNSLHKCIIL
jgi:hypothetical protein